MKKWFKKTVAVVLTAAMAMTVGTPVFANTDNGDIPSGDLYAQNFSETVMLDDVEYTYQYSYDNVGNKLITITNDNNDNVRCCNSKNK